MRRGSIEDSARVGAWGVENYQGVQRTSYDLIELGDEADNHA